jgi:hypothetical protein
MALSVLCKRVHHYWRRMQSSDSHGARMVPVTDKALDRKLIVPSGGRAYLLGNNFHRGPSVNIRQVKDEYEC